jgi:hypothetical protein
LSAPALRRRHVGVALAAAALAALATTAPGLSTTLTASGVRPQVGGAGDESAEVTAALSEREAARLAPTGSVSPDANLAAYAATRNLTPDTRTWNAVTNKPYNSDDPRYADPNASNAGGGAGYVTGRIQGLAVGGGAIYAGGAAGGVFRSTDDGLSWTPISDDLPAMSVGYLALDSAGRLWLATGDGTTGSGTYSGNGVWVNADPKNGSSWTRVGVAQPDASNGVEGTIIRKLLVTSDTAWAATSRGLYSHPTNDLTGGWTRALAPCAGVGLAAVDCSDVNADYRDIVNDLIVDPQSSQHLLANVAWRSGAGYNGFYESTNGGHDWQRTNPTGGLSTQDVGNTTFAYDGAGSRLYAVVESPKKLNASSSLGGVYVSPSGSLSGPWNQAASSSSLASTGSAEKSSVMGHGYQPGVQSWYNQFLTVDPNDANHVYLGLEEVYESHDAGQHWSTIGRYWNFGFTCPCDPNVLHSDQHVAVISGDTLYVGNDGGLYTRPNSPSTPSTAGWTSLSETGHLNTLQYYSVAVGPGSGSAPRVWGGLQDNGVSLLDPANGGTMVSPFGGDGGDQITSKSNGCYTVGEYVYLYLQMTKNCGMSDGSASAVTVIAPSDPNPRFTAPFSADRTNGEHAWVAGGEYLWTNTATWGSTSGSDWTQVGDTGAGHSITALDSRGVGTSSSVIWAGWCGSCNPGGSFASGLVSTVGGTFHQVAVSGLPDRMITGVYADPKDPKSAYVVYGGYSRSWVTGPGDAGVGHVFRVTDNGTTATAANVTGNLPDVPADAITQGPDGSWYVGTDLGAYVTSSLSASSTWKRLALPMTVVDDFDAFNGTLYAATFGRGIFALPGASSTSTSTSSKKH